MASMSGFKSPSCTTVQLGISCHAVIKSMLDNDAAKFKAIKGRFASPVMPGDTLEIKMWKEADRIIFTTSSVESGKVACTLATVGSSSKLRVGSCLIFSNSWGKWLVVHSVVTLGPTAPSTASANLAQCAVARHTYSTSWVGYLACSFLAAPHPLPCAGPTSTHPVPTSVSFGCGSPPQSPCSIPSPACTWQNAPAGS
ncbi:hypothetical protein BASA82_000268 [Batrachochytrium salamandrivorans]|nr:hypothetical protein BASA82_000268 [Batrachochytrium salamandrivorans]